MRALRDFNIPKIVTLDVPIFMGLIGDLFPALNVPRLRDLEFEAQLKKAATDLLLQPEDGFILKVGKIRCLTPNLEHFVTFLIDYPTKRIICGSPLCFYNWLSRDR